MSIITIDSRVSAYRGDPCRILAVCNTTSGKIRIQKDAPYRGYADASLEPIGKTTVLVTDSPSHFANWQMAFVEKEHMQDVILKYAEHKRGGNISLEASMQRHEPSQILQLRKIDKGGSVWEFDSAQTENGHVAVLIAVWAGLRATMGAVIVSDEVPFDQDDPMMPYSLSDLSELDHLNWRNT